MDKKVYAALEVEKKKMQYLIRNCNPTTEKELSDVRMLVGDLQNSCCIIEEQMHKGEKK